MDLEGILQKVITGQYEDCDMQPRDIRTYFVKLNGHEVYSDVAAADASILLDAGFVRVCDDGYDIVAKTEIA